MALDFSLLGQGPTVEGAMNAFRTGREDRRQSNVRNALTQYANDPSKAAPELIANGEVETGMRLQDYGRKQQTVADRARIGSLYNQDPKAAAREAAATGDGEAVELVSGLDKSAQAAQVRQLQAAAKASFILRGATPEQRKALISSPAVSAAFSEAGISPEEAATLDLSDATLDANIQSAQEIDELLKGKRDDAEMTFKRDKLTADREHDLAMERVAGQNADSRRISATRPRAGGGSGKRPVAAMSDAELLAIAGAK